MNADVLSLLHSADPAGNMTEITPEEHARRREAIVATPRLARRRRRLLPRRRLTLIAVTGAILLLGGTAAYGALHDLEPVPQPPPIDVDPDYFQAHGFHTWKQASDQYDVWTLKISLPAEAEWRGHDPGAKDSMFSVGAGAMDTVWEAMGHWTREWIAATDAGDDDRAAVAESWVVRLRALIPVCTNENQSGVDRTTANLLDRGISEAKQGAFSKLGRMVIGYTIPWSAYEGSAPSASSDLPARYPGWKETLVGPKRTGLDEATMTALLSASAADVREEYRSLLKYLDLPSGAAMEDPTARVEGPYYLGEGYVYAFLDARMAWWREWVAADQTGDQRRIAAAAAASARLRKLLPLKQAVDPFVMTQTLDPASMQGFARLDALARQGDLTAIRDWLERQPVGR
jgi:hypothetical protein